MKDGHYTKLVCGIIHPRALWKTTQKKFVEDPARTSMAKIGQPFLMPPDIEIKILKYILNMQDWCLSLKVSQVRLLAFKVVEAAGINRTFNWESQMAGWYWWDKLSLRTPHDLTVCRASTVNSNMLSDFYDKVEVLLTKLDLNRNQFILWTLMKLASLMSYNLVKQSAK